MLKNSDRVRLNSSHLEFAIFSLIKTDLVELIKAKASLSKVVHLQPSEIDKMQMWEFEIFVSQLNAIIENENDQQKQEMDKYQIDKYRKMTEPGYAQKMIPKTPNINISGMPK